MIIDQLPTLSSVNTTDEIPIERSTTTYKTPVSALATRVNNSLSKDSTPTSGSSNPITSGGVYTALAGKADLSTVYRPNMLDNWYFVKGSGTTGDYGVFPVNQRGQSSYGASKNTIDRWKTFSLTSLSLNSDSIRVEATSGNSIKRFSQVIDHGLKAGTYTFSILCKVNEVSGDCRAGFFIGGQYNVSYMVSLSATTGYQLFQKTYTLAADTADVEACVFGTSASESSFKVDIIAMKVELGDTQTLAHQVGGEWVLNELPNYEEELRKCQHYLWIAYYNQIPIAFGSVFSSTQIRFLLPTPVGMSTVKSPLASYPTMTISGGSFYIDVAGSTIIATTSNFSVRGCSDAGIFLVYTDSGFTAYNPAILRWNSSSTSDYIMFSAEL